MAAGSHFFFGISPDLVGVAGAAVLRAFGATRDTGFASAMFRFPAAFFSEVDFSFVFIIISGCCFLTNDQAKMWYTSELNNGYPTRVYSIKAKIIVQRPRN